MSTVEELAYIEVEASDLAAWRTLAEDVLGLQSVEAGAGRLAYRIDEFAHRIQIREGAADDLTALGFRVADDATFDALVADLKSAGHGGHRRDRRLPRPAPGAADGRGHRPNGNRVELVTGMALAETPFESPPLGVNGFMTSPGGLGHLFLMCAPGGRQEMLDFYALLGFILSDYIQQEIAPGMLVDAAFTHCNGRHHTLAFAEMPIPKKANHLMIEVKTISDVGLAYDRILDRRIPLVMTLGMHPQRRDVLLLRADPPSGFAIEYGWGGLIIDDEESWEVTTYDRLSSWGSPAAEDGVGGPQVTELELRESDVRVDGLRLRVYETGNAGDQPILWLHGSGPGGVSSLSNWQALITSMPGYHHIAPDVPGFGESEHLDPMPRGIPASAAARSEVLLHLLDTMGGSRRPTWSATRWAGCTRCGWC